MPLRPLEEIARQWVPGDGPVEVQPLAYGLVNDTYRVARAGGEYSLRVAKGDSAELGLDRGWECRLLACAAAAGVAPVIHRCEPAEGILVSGWVPGRAWTPAEIQESGNIDAMARLLRRVHSLSVPRPSRNMNPAAWIDRYTSALARLESDAPARTARLCEAAADRLRRLAASESASVLCHSDMHRLNVLAGDQLLLLDWEYAHVSDPFWDLAGWVSNNDGTQSFAAELLASYLQRPARREESAHLSLLTWLYDYVCLTWSQLYLRLRPGGGTEVAARAEHLARRLESASGGRAGQVPAH